MLLVLFSDNYADEFDVNGFTVVDEETWNKYLEHLHKEFENDKEITWYFGTNEELIWRSENEIDYKTVVGIADNGLNRYAVNFKSALQRLLESYEVKEIDDIQFEFIKNYISKKDFGFFPWIGW